jgi:L-fuconolactonase
MPWLDALPALQQPFELPDVSVHTQGLAVQQLVYVQVDVAPAYSLLEARWALSQAEHDPRLAAIVAFAPLDDGPPAAAYLTALADLGARIKGVRRLLQGESDPDFPIRADLLHGLRLLPRYGFSFDICIRHDQLPRTIEMVRACPETSFVLDHLGKPDIKNQQLEPWRTHLAELARLPNVVCKVSGLVTEADHANWTITDLEPYVAHALDVFGDDRVLFGGDWPVVTLASSYATWVGTLQGLTATLSAAAKRKLWADNARRVYRL